MHSLPFGNAAVAPAASIIAFPSQQARIEVDQDQAAPTDARSKEATQPSGSPTPRSLGPGLAPWQIKRARAYIDAHLADRPSLAQVAKQVRLSVSYFGKNFHRSFGLSYAKFMHGERVRRAQQLMLTTDMRLCDVAIHCGFADQAHLSRVFRQEVGSPPAAWRRHARIVGPSSILVSARLRAET